MKVKINSLRNKFVVYFSIFAISIFILLWILQVLFINTNYKQMLEKELVRIGKKVAVNYTDEMYLDKIAYKNAIDIIVISKTGQILYLTDGMKQSAMRPNFIDLELAIDKIKLSNNQHETYIATFSRFNLQRLIYSGKTDTGYIVLTSNVEPIGSVTKVLSAQLLYISIISIILSFIISLVLSKKIVKPISAIADKAKEIGKGNYSVVFEQTEYEEINNLSNSLNYSAGELKKTDTLRKELIANVSHDIRTPLTIIKSYAEMIKDISGSSKQKRELHLDTIINQADLLTKLTEDMMDLSKLETNTYKLNISKFNIIDSIVMIVDGFKYLGDYKYIINIENNKKEIIVKADKVKIEQVIYNIVSNAVNYAGEDNIIYINVIEKESVVRVEVRDNGKGIKKEDLPYIFDRYYKSNDKQRKSGFGTGLGLSIVKNILEMHVFKYGIESETGVGTIVYFEVNKD